MPVIEAVRRRLAPFATVSPGVADVIDLAFADDSLDVVTRYLMSHHVIDWKAALTEAARVLRPGGILVGYDVLDTRAATWFHRADRSAHVLIQRSQ